MKENVIKKLSDREHILLKPNMYLGGITEASKELYVIYDGRVQLKSVSYVQGLLKIIDEILDNSIDEAIRTNFKFANKINITIKDQEVQIEDNGRGIPQTIAHGNLPMAVVAFTEARAGSNFSDETKANGIGTNGVGSYLTNVFSRKFVVETCDGKNALKLISTENASSFDFNISPSDKQGTKVNFLPDLDKFGLDRIADVYVSLIENRLTHLAQSFPQIQFKLNSNTFKAMPPKKYLEMFSGDYEMIQGDNYIIAVTANESDDFKLFTYVNGLDIRSGGAHIDLITNEVVGSLREKIGKKYKDIKPGDIKNKLRVIALFQDFPNCQFDSQTKERVTNSAKDVRDYLGEIDFEQFSQKIFKNVGIINPIIEIFKLKLEFKRRQELKALEKPSSKKPKDEKLLSPIGEWTNCYLCEGDSAQNSISKIIGRQGNGFYAMFGVPPNAYDMKLSDIIKSDKMKGLQSVLGLKYSQDYQDNLYFKNIIIATDADLPGFFIRMQLLGMLYRFGKNLFEEKRIKILRTPVVVGYDNKENIKVWFYDLDDLKEYEANILNGTKPKYSFEYKKGLGSWDQKELEFIIHKDGLETMLETMVLDDKASESIHNWLSGDMADKRKDMLEGFEFSIANM